MTSDEDNVSEDDDDAEEKEKRDLRGKGEGN